MNELLHMLDGSVGLGLATALAPTNLLYCFIGVLLGMVVGVLPGIGPLAAISMLFPLTFHLDATPALIMLAGIWYGTGYGGAIACVLLNVPGTPSHAVMCLDGFPLAQQGKAGSTLMMSTTAGFVGGSVGILMMMLFSPVIVVYAIKFGAAEYFALMLLGLVAASTISVGSPVKSMAMVTVGIILGTVGMDVYTGTRRFTFGSMDLADGISLVSLAMGLFGVAQVIDSVGRLRVGVIDRAAIRLKAMVPTREDFRRARWPILRGAFVGGFLGTLPGTGPTIAAFMAYAVEKRSSRHPERFGRGAIEGVVAPEASSNAADQTAFIPTMTLGIPGSPTMAIMIGALMIKGIAPGPNLIAERPDLFWGLVMSFWIGNLLLVLLNVPMIGIWIRLLMIPYHYLYPAILMFICIGVYSVNDASFDVWMVLIFGVLGYLMRLAELPTASVLLGFVLGPMMEEHFRRAMLMSGGDPLTFVETPISGGIMAFVAGLLLWVSWSAFKGWRIRSRRKESAQPVLLRRQQGH